MSQTNPPAGVATAPGAIRINLLPASYMEAKHRRREMRVYGVLLVLAVVLAGGWWQAAQLGLAPLRAASGDAQRQLAAERARQEELTAPRTEYQRLRAISSLRSEVSEPIPMTLVTSLLAQLLPDRSVLSRLTVELPQLVIEPPAPPGAQPGAPRAGAVTGAPKALAEIKPQRIELIGLSRTDGDVARTVSRLADHPLFARVNLQKSKQVLDGGPPRVSFTITLEVPLNRKFILPPDIAQGSGKRSAAGGNREETAHAH